MDDVRFWVGLLALGLALAAAALIGSAVRKVKPWCRKPG
jgi:hypothetical protein